MKRGNQGASGSILAGNQPIERIAHASDAPQPVRFAARELQRYLGASAGASLAIEEGGPGPGTFFLATSETDRTAADLLGSAPEGRHDRAVAAVRDASVWLVGENPISTLFAVYDLLKTACGLRFFGPGAEHEHVPRCERLDLPRDGELVRRGSDFALRDYWVSDPDTIDFAVKNRINMISMGDSPGGDLLRFLRDRGVTLRGPGHIWGRFVPDKALFAAHPEYFPLLQGERRVNGRTACFSNPAVRRIFLDNLRAYLRANPEWDVFAFWAEDTADPFYCGCAECARRTLPEWYLVLVNEAARVVAEELPRARFEFIAYHGTRNPPARSMPLFDGGRNLLLNLCVGYTRNLYEPLAHATNDNAEILAMYRNWRRYLDRIAYQGQVMLMEYYNLCETPNQGPRGRALLWPMEVIREDTRFYRAEGLDGLGDWVCMRRLCWPSPFFLWTWLQLYSDCDTSVETYKDDFYPRYFGPVAAQARAYMDALVEAMHAPTTPGNLQVVRTLAERLDAMEAMRLPPETAKRVRILRVHHDYSVLLKDAFLAFRQGEVERWRTFEQPLRDYFEKTYRADLEGEIDIPPAWAYNWCSRIANRQPEELQAWASDPLLH